MHGTSFYRKNQKIKSIQFLRMVKCSTLDETGPDLVDR